MFKLLRLLFVLAFISNSACSHLTIHRADDRPEASAPQTVEVRSYLFGFIPGSRLIQAELCAKSQIETMELGMDSEDVLLTLVTFGIYVPHRVQFTCAKVLSAAQ